MTPYFVTDSTGRILRTGIAPTEAAALIQAPFDGETAHIGAADQRTQYWDGSALADRPTLPDPPALTAGVAADWTLPAGAEVTVFAVELDGNGLVTSEVEARSATWAGTEPLSLPAGAWRIVVNPPFPFRSAEWTIEVSP